MKFSAVLAFIAAVTVVSASTNAERFARGLGPNAPVKRATPAARARRSSPSGVSQCNTGSLHCCDSTSSGSSSVVQELAGLLGITVPVNAPVGLNCSPITAVGVGSGAQCTQQTVCCSGNSFNGLINLGCSPININL
ncbi:hydrophobin [Imleria badia]|nr:hydrophobin [Imleria badia]